VTGANDVMVVRRVAPKLGDLAVVTCAGHEKQAAGGGLEAVVEGSALRPLLRGADVRAWRFDYAADVLWAHDPATLAYAPPRRLRAFLDGQAARFKGSGGPGRLQRLGADSLGAKVAWQDIASNLNAVCVPASVRSRAGFDVPVVPLNTVYFVPLAEEADALLLAAYLNSLPVRTFARAIAERAKDARFRFFATTVAVLPLPREWRSGRCAERLRAISARAHADGRIDEAATEELDALVARAYGLRRADVEVLARFDAWLRGDAGSGAGRL
jgi:hypothetical protein